MPTVEELTVALKQDGMRETTSGLENVENKFDDTASSVDDSATEMTGFASKFKGAMGAVVAGLAVAAGGLLSQVPVIGEAFGGLASVFDAIVFQIDQKLRPALQPVTDGFYDLSAAIFEGDWQQAGNIIGNGITSFVDKLKSIDPVALGENLSNAFVSAVQTIDWSQVPGLIVDAILLNFKFLTFGAQVLAGFIKGIVNAAQETDWGEVASDIFDFLLDGVTGAFDWVKDKLQPAIDAINGIWDTLTDIGDWATSAVEGAFGWLSDALTDPLGTVEDIWNTLTDIAGETFDTVVEVIMELIPDIGFTEGEIQQLRESGQAGQDMANYLESMGFIGPNGNPQATTNTSNNADFSTNPSINMNGRRMTEETGRYRSDSTSRRGRFG